MKQIKRLNDLERVGLLTHLVKELESVSPQVGNTVLQKMTYFLQRVYGVPFGYRFSLYYYGPHCYDLSYDTSVALALNALEQNDAELGYNISLGSKADEWLKQEEETIMKYKSKIDRIVNNLGAFKALELELFSTIHFVFNKTKEEQTRPDKEQIIATVQQLKPKFAKEKINESYEKLQQLDFIKV